MKAKPLSRATLLKERAFLAKQVKLKQAEVITVMEDLAAVRELLLKETMRCQDLEKIISFSKERVDQKTVLLGHCLDIIQHLRVDDL